MPTVEVDVSRYFEDLLDRAFRYRYWYGDLNAGQREKLARIRQSVISTVVATAEVNISGDDVDINIEAIFDDYEFPDWLELTKEEFQQIFEVAAEKLSQGRSYDSREMIKTAFANL